MTAQQEQVKNFIGTQLSYAKDSAKRIEMTSKQFNKLSHYIDSDDSTWYDCTDEYGLWNDVSRYTNENQTAEIVIMPFCGNTVELRFIVL